MTRAPETQHGPRHRDWQARLTRYLSDCAREDFRHGVQDCLLFAAGAIAAMTQGGHDYAAAYRGQYDTLEGGLALLKASGFDSHVAIVTHHLAVKHIAFAMPGDIAQLGAGRKALFGIVQGPRIYVLKPEGLGSVSLMSAKRAFEV